MFILIIPKKQTPTLTRYLHVNIRILIYVLNIKKGKSYSFLIHVHVGIQIQCSCNHGFYKIIYKINCYNTITHRVMSFYISLEELCRLKKNK